MGSLRPATKSSPLLHAARESPRLATKTKHSPPPKKKVSNIFCCQLRPESLLRFLLFFYPFQGKGAHSYLPSAPQAGSWELMSPLLSKAVARLQFHPSFRKFPLASRLTSHPHVIPVMCQSADRSLCSQRILAAGP